MDDLLSSRAMTDWKSNLINDAAGIYHVIPVPVYYPEVTEILGKKVFRKVADIDGPVDMVNVFRRPNDIPQHVDDIVAKKPKYVWFQLGIRNDGADVLR